MHPEERLISAIAGLIADPARPPVRHAAIGAASPIPAAACMLLRAQGQRMRLSLLASPRGNPFSAGARELFDLAGQGRIDLFFLGGGQIDGQANLNLIGTGDWPGRTARFPGSFGSAYMHLVVPRTILFREEHSRRVLVPRVDFVSAPGVSPPDVFRRGHAEALVTGRAVFSFDPARARFTLASMHPGEDAASIRDATGFAYDVAERPLVTPDPDPAALALLRGPVAEAMRPTYPSFCARLWGAQPTKVA